MLCARHRIVRHFSRTIVTTTILIDRTRTTGDLMTIMTRNYITNCQHLANGNERVVCGVRIIKGVHITRGIHLFSLASFSIALLWLASIAIAYRKLTLICWRMLMIMCRCFYFFVHVRKEATWPKNFLLLPRRHLHAPLAIEAWLVRRIHSHVDWIRKGCSTARR